MTPQQQLELEAAAFRRLVEHLQKRTDVQNIDLMNLAGFCRNCLGNWYAEAAAERGLAIGKDEARETIYGMPYAEWRAKHQKEASPQQQAAFVAHALECDQQCADRQKCPQAAPVEMQEPEPRHGRRDNGK